MPNNAQLFQYLKDRGIAPQDLANDGVCSLSYARYVMRGYGKLRDGLKYRLLVAYPGTAQFLLPWWKAD